MCGIFGIIGSELSASSLELKLEEMKRSLIHRGPDDQGTFIDNSGLAGMGHTRLSILDLSPRGHNPFFSPDGRYILIYNGEVFNFKEIRKQLDGFYDFKTETDTEVILASFLKWGPDCVHHFEGMFAFVVWDKQNQELFAARDPFGIKPFYYEISESGELRFASEIKALLAIQTEREPNWKVIQEFLKFGLYDHSDESFFEGIKKLPPASFLKWKNKKIEIRPYWDLSKVEKTEHKIPELIEEIQSKLDHLVKIALRSDVRVGINLSGGVDSAALLALSKQGSQALECFSQDYKNSVYSESQWIRATARNYEADLNLCYLSAEQFASISDKVLWYQDEPYAGVPVAAYASLYQATQKRGVTVLLDGNGLDEAFGGYKIFHQHFLNELAQKQSPEFLKHLKSYNEEWNESLNKSDFPLGLSKSYQKARDGSQSTNSQLLAADFLQENIDPPYFERAFSSELKQSIYQDIHYTKIPRALRFNDRISMAFSRELRVPFLSRDLFELCFSIPNEQLFFNGRPKALLREALHARVPDQIRLAPKRHIQSPQTPWLTKELHSYLGEVFHSQSFKQRGLYDSEKMIQEWKRVKTGKINNSFYLWQAANLENWFKLFIDEAGKMSQNLDSDFPQLEYRHEARGAILDEMGLRKEAL